MRIAAWLLLGISGLTLAGCASAPASKKVGINAAGELTSVRQNRSGSIEQFVDSAALQQAASVSLPKVSVVDGAYEPPITDLQAGLVANQAGRQLCAKLGRYFVINEQAPDLRLQVVVTKIAATSRGASGVSALVGVVSPVPFRLPTGLGGLAIEGSAESPDGAQRLLQRWAKGANPIFNRAKVSLIGDAYQLAGSFAKNFAKTLLLAARVDPSKALARLDRKAVKTNQLLCDAQFGRANLAGRGASILLPLSPESIDAGTPVQTPNNTPVR